MAGRNFRELLEARWSRGSFLCIGLDSELRRIPEAARRAGTRETLVAFNRAIVDATLGLVCAYKPNIAFYEAHGDEGWSALRETIQYIHEEAPEVPVILDAKRADIGNTNGGYAEAVFEHLRADAVTVHPYLGREAVAPFLDRVDKGVFVLCRTSNHGSGEFQDLKVGSGGEELYKVVARHVAGEWNAGGNCGLVVGATYPEELAEVRVIAGDLPILIPGIGAQGGDLEKTIAAGKRSGGGGMIIAASRGIIFASAAEDFAAAAAVKAAEYDAAIRKMLQ